MTVTVISGPVLSYKRKKITRSSMSPPSGNTEEQAEKKKKVETEGKSGLCRCNSSWIEDGSPQDYRAAMTEEKK